MSESTTTTAPVNPHVPAARDWLRDAANRERADKALSRLACWAAATEEERAGLRLDYAWAAGNDGIPESEYLQAVDEWATSPDCGGVQGYLAESDLWPLPPGPGGAVDRSLAEWTRVILDPTLRPPVPDATEQSPAPNTEHLERMLANVQRLQAQVDAEKAGPAEAQAQGAADAAQQAQADAEAQEAEAREEAVRTLKACVAAYRKGERAYRDGLLESGRLADLYVHQRLTLGDKRDVARQALEGQLAVYATGKVDANRLIHCWHAYRLLALETGLVGDRAAKKAGPADAVPYGHYRDAWKQLVHRVAEDTPEERWELLPGVEEEAKAAFAAAVKAGLSADASAEKAKALVAVWVNRRAEATKAAAAETRRLAEAKAAEVAASRKAVEESERRKAELERQAREAQQAEVRAQLTEAARQEEERLRAEQRAHAVAVDEAVVAERERLAKEALAKAAQEALAKAEEKARKAEEKANKPAQSAQNVPPAVAAPAGETPPLPHKPEPQSAPVRKQIAAAVAKDAAEVLADAILHHDTPDDVLAELLRQLKGSKELHRTSRVAIDAAVVIIDRGDKTPSPVQVAQQTGSPAPSAPKAEPVAAA
jgi:hypothetical protein